MPPRAAVDQPHAGLHQGDRFVVDQVRRFGRERRVDGEVIDVRQHVADFFDARDAELGRLLGGEERIVAEHAHLKRQGPLGDFLADAAQADDAERLVGELRAHEGLAVPLALAELGIGFGHAPRQGEHQREGVLGRAERVARRRVHHHDAQPRGGFLVDVVGADAGPGDRPQPLVSFQHVAADRHAAAADRAVELGQGLFQGVALQAGADFVLDARLAAASRSRPSWAMGSRMMMRALVIWC